MKDGQKSVYKGDKALKRVDYSPEAISRLHIRNSYIYVNYRESAFRGVFIDDHYKNCDTKWN
jgi:hypothetical protein